MKWRIILVLTVWCLIALSATADDRTEAEKAVDALLSSLHRAASDADGDLYFSLFAEGAIFMGTDATERWSVEEFRAFAEPYFSEGRGWNYSTTERHIYVAGDGATAWFDEMLWNETYGTCRGTGVLVHAKHGWRIAQYNLSIPLPNDVARELTIRIKEFNSAPPN
jgi:hypothetical protein